MNTSILLQLKNIEKTYCVKGKKIGLEKINFDINHGDFISVIGRSGTGKSTLLNLIAGLIEPSSGEIISDKFLSVKMVFQDYALIPWLNVKDNIALACGSLHQSLCIEKKEKARTLIDLIGLTDFTHVYPAELSGGMAQRVGFARALLAEPDILLLDEAFSSLDSLSAHELKTDFKQMIQENALPIKAVVMVTHNITEALEMGNRMLILSGQPARISRDDWLDDTTPDDQINQKTIKKYHQLLSDI